jgi:predicted small lipoprotein YifL
MSFRRLVPLLIFVLPLAACGNKGPLVRPAAKPGTPAEQPTPAPASTAPSPEPTGH